MKMIQFFIFYHTNVTAIHLQLNNDGYQSRNTVQRKLSLTLKSVHIKVYVGRFDILNCHKRF